MNSTAFNRIDSATLYQLVEAFSHGDAAGWTDWDRNVVLALTIAFIGDPEFSVSLSPSPENAGDASGPYALLIDMMRATGAIRDEVIGPARAKKALLRTKKISAKRVQEIRGLHLQLLADPRNFQPWLDWVISQAWVENSQRLGGLFNVSLLPEIGNVLRRSQHDLSLSLRDSQNTALVRRFAADGASAEGEGFELMRDAYIVSALIRGIYHAAVYNSDRVIQHPLRQLLRLTEGPPLGTFMVDREHLLASIIVNSAVLTERSESKRIARWTDDLSKARAAHIASRMPMPVYAGVRKSRLDSESYGYDDAQWANVADLLKGAGMIIYPGWRDMVFDLGLPLSLGMTAAGISQAVLTGWAALITTSTVTAVTATASYAWGKRPDKRLGPTFYTHPNALRDLAHYPPGRVVMPETSMLQSVRHQALPDVKLSRWIR